MNRAEAARINIFLVEEGNWMIFGIRGTLTTVHTWGVWNNRVNQYRPAITKVMIEI